MPAARNAINQPFVDAIQKFLDEQKLTRSAFCGLLYGRDDKGNPKGTGGVYPLFNGQVSPTPFMVNRIKEKTGLDLSGIERLPPSGAPQAVTPVKAVLQAYRAKGGKPEKVVPSTALTTIPIPMTKRAGAEASLVSLSVSGRVTLSLTDVTADDAVRTLNALVAAGVLK